MAEKIKVLVADDHAMFRDGLDRMLNNEEDIECVATAGDGEQAINLAKEFLPDVAIIDVAMPRMNGIEAAKQIKAACPSIAILIVSAYKYRYYILACMKARVSGYLLKDSGRDELVNAIRMIHAGKTVFDHEIASKIQDDLASKQNTGGGTPVLGNRELEVLSLAATGMGNKEIGHRLNISVYTVSTHLVHIFRKLGVESRTAAILYTLKEGWFNIDDVNHKPET